MRFIPQNSFIKMVMLAVTLGILCLFPLQALAVEAGSEALLFKSYSSYWQGLDLGDYIGFMNDSREPDQVLLDSSSGSLFQPKDLTLMIDSLDLDWKQDNNPEKTELHNEVWPFHIQDLSQLSLFSKVEAISFEEKFLSDIEEYKLQGQARVTEGVNLEMAHKKKLRQSGLQVITVEEVSSAGVEVRVLPIATLGAEYARLYQDGGDDLGQTNYNLNLQLSSKARVKALFSYLLSDLEEEMGSKTGWEEGSIDVEMPKSLTSLGLEYKTSDEISVMADIIADELSLSNNEYKTMIGVRYTGNGNLIAIHYRQEGQQDARVRGGGIEFGLLDQALISAVYSTEEGATVPQKATMELDFDFSLGEDVLLNMGYKRIKEETDLQQEEDLENLLEATLEIRF